MSIEDDKLLAEAVETFDEIVDVESRDRERYREDQRFSAGEQWPEDVRRAREQDPFGARPCLTFDKIGQYRRQVANDARQNNPAIRVIPAGEGADDEVAEILSDVIRYVENRSRADIAKDTAIDSAVTVGLGWFAMRTEMTNSASNEQDIRIDRIPNVFSVYADPDWKEPDGSDIRRLFITDEMPRKRFEAMYPKANTSSWEGDLTNRTNWATREFVRIAEYYRINETKQNEIYLEDGTSILESDFWKQYEGIEPPTIIGTRYRKTRIVEWAKLTGGEVLDKTTIPGEYIPVFPVIGNEHWIDGRRVLTGMVRGVMDAQRAYNYARTAYIETVALAPKAPWLTATGQTEEYPEWADANTRNYSQLRYSPVEGAPPPQRQNPPTPPTGWLQDMQIAEHDIQSAVGMYSASIGKNESQKSGRALLAEQREGDTSTFHYIDNLSRTLKHCGNVMVSWIPKVYDTKRVLQIIGEDGSQSQVTLLPGMRQALVKAKDEAGNVKRIFNPAVGKYSVVVSVGPSYNSKRQEAAASMMELFGRNPGLMQAAGDIMVRAMDWPMADDLAKRLKAMVPPQILQASEDEDSNAEVQAAVQAVQQQAQAQMQSLMQALQQLQEQNQKSEQELQGLKAQAANKLMEAQIKGAELQQGAELKQLDYAIKMRELDLAEQKIQLEAAQVQAAELQKQMQPAESWKDMPATPEQIHKIIEYANELEQKVTAIAEEAAKPKRKKLTVKGNTGGEFTAEAVEENGVKKVVIKTPSGAIYQGVSTKAGNPVALVGPNGPVKQKSTIIH